MDMYLGSGYYSTKGMLSTTKENEEIIPETIENIITKEKTKLNGFSKLSFMNPNSNCTVIINNKDELTLVAGYGFCTDFEDYKISSFKIKETGIDYFYYAEY